MVQTQLHTMNIACTCMMHYNCISLLKLQKIIKVLHMGQLLASIEVFASSAATVTVLVYMCKYIE